MGTIQASPSGVDTVDARQLLRTLRAIKKGDFSVRMTLDNVGIAGEVAEALNDVIDLNERMANEFARIRKVVGEEGKVSERASLGTVSGSWSDCVDLVNSLIGYLAQPTTEMARVIGAVAKGDLSQTVALEVEGRAIKGEFLRIAKTINTMVAQLSSFTSEVTRVAREVGTEGKLGGQAEVKGVAGTWKDLTDSVNSMAFNLTSQVRNIAEVTTAVAKGDLSKKITVDVRGEILELKDTINTMVDQLSSFASEVTRVAREVGTEGRLGGQAFVKGVAGTWKDLTDNVNYMASNLTGQVRNIAEVTTAVANGDLSKKITVDVRGELLELKNTINTMVDQLNSFASEVTRVAREVGTEGRLGGQAEVRGVGGTWKDLTDNVNYMASNLTGQVRNIAEVTTAVANGDLSKKITVDVRGELLELKNTINTMVDQLNSFASEVTRVARDVGTEGKLGGQADVKGVGGTWKDLTDNVNYMASNLTAQVRGIAKVVTAVAQGDLKRKLQLEAKGEIAALADTINEMIDTLAIFADQVTTVAREVGFEGKLGGQAKVPGAAGTWRDLTDNVNQLAANLTTQVRAIAEVATAVTQGDLTRSIAVEAQGEVAELKDNINQMISNLRATTQRNTEQDWLQTNLAKFTRMLQGQRDLEAVSRLILSELAPLVSAQHGVFYIMGVDEGEPVLKLLSSYAFRERKRLSSNFMLGEGLIGQCAYEKQRILVTDVPTDYVRIGSGLGEAAPLNLIVMPVLFEGQVKAVIELASFHSFSEIHTGFLDQLTESIGIMLNTIEATMRTEELLKQSQALTEELQSQQDELTQTNKRLEQQAHSLQASEELLKQQQDELRQTNEELQDKAKLLSSQNTEVERKNHEIELARKAIEEKAEQLAVTSKYKSEFLANMSHELRTPLNSLLILSELLSAEPNLTNKQVDFAQTIHSAGIDLLNLINEILDLSKIESGTMSVDVNEIKFWSLRNDMERLFRQVAEDKKLSYTVELDRDLPTTISTDLKRLQQVLRNLLSNAFKFTESGQVTLRIRPATAGWDSRNESLSRADAVIAFEVIDTGIGIAANKQKIVFEAFQQADGTTSRKYGGTGLGLAISREIARLLGGEIHLESTPGQGSTFTLYLPDRFQPVGLTGGMRLRHTRRVPVMEPSELAPVDAPGELELLMSESGLEDDRASINPGDCVLLVIEDDLKFAGLMLNQAHESNFKVLVADRGDVGLALARKYLPDAISLDINLPDIDGWKIFDMLKHDAKTRHIPVHFISVEPQRNLAMHLGAFGYIQKPASKESIESAICSLKDYLERPVKSLLVIESDPDECTKITQWIGNSDVSTSSAHSGAEAIETVKNQRFDCIVLDPALSDLGGVEFLRRLKEVLEGESIPVIVYAAKALSPEEQSELKALSDTMTVKEVNSLDHLVQETALFLHRVEANLPEPKRRMLSHANHTDTILSGRKVLIVDDDVRNIFAITSALERSGMITEYAENGADGLAVLENTPGIDVVLMDVMMPNMDGYETMRHIRQSPRFQSLPIIALTAKAMKADREKCLEAGASDYIAKPVDVEQLLSLIRVCLYRQQ